MATSAEHDDTTGAALGDLARVVEEVRRDLVDDLRRCEQRHGVDARTVFAEQERIADLDRWGAAPELGRYVVSEAEPRARQLSTAAMAVIDHHLGVLDASLPPPPPRRRRTDRRPALRSGAEAAALVRPLGDALPEPVHLHAVGDRWQARLRRSALREGAIELLWSPAGEAVERLHGVELLLVDKAPWAHGDQLLRAVEASWIEVGRYLRAEVDERCARLDPPPPDRLTAALLSP